MTVEWKLHPEEVEFQVYRSKLQLFSLAGGASRNDLRGSVAQRENENILMFILTINASVKLLMRHLWKCTNMGSVYSDVCQT